MDEEVNFKKAYDDLSEEVKTELVDLRSLLLEFDKNHSGIVQVNNEEIIKRIAKLCLLMMEQTPHDDKGIRETAYLITSYFMFNEYENKNLDEAVSIFGTLELPKDHINSDNKELWNDAKALLEKA